jgi:hypothetical protein
MRTRRALFPLAAVVAAAVAVIAPASAASASPLPVINVHESDHGFTVDGALTRRAGRVTFHYTTTTTNQNGGSEVDLLQIRRGHTFAEAEQAAAMEGSDNPATAADGTRGLQSAVHFFGGANLNLPSQSENITETLYAGTYYLVDVGSHGTPQITPIHVSGTPSSIPIVPGTTDATIQTLLTSNSSAPPPQILGPGFSAGILSPGTQEVVSSASLTPGSYVLVCFIADDVTGMPHALMGMHLVVTVK